MRSGDLGDLGDLPHEYSQERSIYTTTEVSSAAVSTCKGSKTINETIHFTLFGRKHGALCPLKPFRLIRDGEVCVCGGEEEEGGREFYNLTHIRYTITTRMTLH